MRFSSRKAPSRSVRSARRSRKAAARPSASYRRRGRLQIFESLEPRQLLSATPLSPAASEDPSLAAGPLSPAAVYTHPVFASLIAPNISVPLLPSDGSAQGIPPQNVPTCLPFDLFAAGSSAGGQLTTFTTTASAGTASGSGSGFTAAGTAANTIYFDVPENEFVTDITPFQGDVSLVKRGLGTLVLGGESTFTGGLVVEEGSVVIRHPSALGNGALTVLASSRLTLDIGSQPIALTDLTLAATATLDLGAAALTITSPTLVVSDLREVLSEAAPGRIVSSAADASEAIGYAANPQNHMVLQIARPGDTQLDGHVNFDDILALFPNYNAATDASWSDGDFTYDGVVNFDDILALFPNYGLANREWFVTSQLNPPASLTGSEHFLLVDAPRAVHDFNAATGEVTFRVTTLTSAETALLEYELYRSGDASPELGLDVVDLVEQTQHPLTIALDTELAAAGGVLTIEGSRHVQTIAIAPGSPLQQTFTLTLPAGDYLATFESDAHHVSPSVSFTALPPDGFSASVSAASDDAGVDFSSVPDAGYPFHYIWEGSFESPTGYEYAQNVLTPPEVTFLDNSVEQPDAYAVATLIERYGIYLSTSGSPWNSILATRLLQTLEDVPMLDPLSGPGSLWTLTDTFLDNDIVFQEIDGAQHVTISNAAFVNASDRLASVDGDIGLWRSNRLFNALVRWVTDNGTDDDATAKILTDRFGVQVHGIDYPALTGEPAANFQAFNPDEYLILIKAFEDMPEGMHRLDSLRQLVRRRAGHINLNYPEAPAIAWVGAGYVEFMDSAFTCVPHHMHRLMIHEKAHFLYGAVLTDAIRTAWQEVGGWQQRADGSWFTEQTTQFASAYAHLKNPDEDFAESVSYYIVNPDKLRAHAPLKYDFLRSHVMHGSQYLSVIREDLTFEVLNLFPDYVYPGKIQRVEVIVEGDPEEDKNVEILIDLDDRDGDLASATHLFMRLVSPADTFIDLYLSPRDDSGFRFRGTLTLSKYAAAGRWAPPQIQIADSVGNYRFQHVGTFGWLMEINNPLEDLLPPVLDVDSVAIRELPAATTPDGLRKIEVSFEFTENQEAEWVFTRIVAPTGTLWDAYGSAEYLGEADSGDLLYRGTVTWNIKEYHQTGDYTIGYITLADIARNQSNWNIHDTFTTIVTSNPDTLPPELDLVNISIVGVPTNPDRPNGETYVTLTYRARDDNSGLGWVSLRLRDPQGNVHHFWHYHQEFYRDEFDGDPTVWAEYVFTTILPEGSAPGIWGLSDITLQDKALNRKDYTFTEVVEFTI